MIWAILVILAVMQFISAIAIIGLMRVVYIIREKIKRK